jgi:hypothetical protein
MQKIFLHLLFCTFTTLALGQVKKPLPTDPSKLTQEDMKRIAAMTFLKRSV